MPFLGRHGLLGLVNFWRSWRLLTSELPPRIPLVDWSGSMSADIPKCPRCPNGGNVKLISNHQTTAAINGGRKEGADVFQCSCGWTLARTIPWDRPPDDGN